MKQIFSQFKAAFARDRLYATTCVFLLLTVASIFIGSAVLNVSVPLVGEIFPFRVFLPITLFLYLVWALKGGDRFWKDASSLEKWIFVLIGMMILYGAVSLLWAANFLFSFKRLFNLCFDLAFFFLLLRLCRNKVVLQSVIITILIGFFLFCGLGIYEAFHMGIFDDIYDRIYGESWFMEYLHLPVVTAGNTNDYCSILVFLAAVFLIARVLGVFDKNSPFIKYSPVAIFPLLFFLITIAGARLNIIAFWILLIVTILCDLLSGFCKKRIYTLIALAMCCVTFCHQYRQINPRIQNFAEQAKAYYHYQVARWEHYLQNGSLENFDSTISPPPTKPKPETDNSQQGQSKPTLKDEFFASDENGNTTLSTSDSAGIRTRLLIHSGKCFLESYGLGVGLGNTEVYAAQRGVIPKWANNESISIHCFLARIIADFGIFVLIPLCAITFLLLKKVWHMLIAGYKTKNHSVIANMLLILGCIGIFPIASTASSDAQDLWAMWLFLAILILFSQKFSPSNDPNLHQE